MAGRGRPKADNESRDRAVLHRVFKAIYDRRGVAVTLRGAPGKNIRGSKSAYEIAQSELGRLDKIFLSTESIAKIFRAGKDTFLGHLGEGDVAANLRVRQKRAQKRLSDPRVYRGDGPDRPGPKVRLFHGRRN